MNIFILILTQVLVKGTMYDEENLYNCEIEDESDEYSLVERQQKLKLFPIDCWVFVLLSPITLYFAIRITYVFLRDMTLFGIPGNVIFAINVTNGVQAMIQFSTAIYVFVNDAAPVAGKNEDNIFCEITGIGTSIVFLVSNLNIFIFAAYPLALVYNALEKTSKLVNIFNYSFVFIILLIAILEVAFKHQIISVALNGICAISATKSRGWDFVITLVYLFVFVLFATMSIIFIFTFKKLVPKLATFKQLRGQYLRYYQRFISFSLIMKLLLGIFSALNLLNCYFILSAWLEVSETLQNVSQAICILGQVLLIYYMDPQLRHKFSNSHINDNNQQNLKSSTASETKVQEISMQQFNILGQLHHEVKKTQVISLLAGVLLLKKQKQESIIQYKDLILNEEQDDGSNSSQGDLSELMDAYFQPFTVEEIEECQAVQLNNEVAKENEIVTTDIDIFSMRCILYAPKIFQYFTTLDNIDLEEAFDLAKNLSKIDQFTTTDGGKSGEFFYFSHNNGLIIKTMRQSEVHTFKKRLFNFATYLVNKPQSLLAKIYGLYTFERQESKAKIHFLIMKNISLGIPRNLILRTYDLKGSEFDREVLAKKPESDLSKMTLKDTDFLKIEHEVWIDEQKKKLLNQSLSLDCEFLEKQKLIDYSLLIMIIDWKEQEQRVLQFLDDQQLNIIPSIKENGVYYHFAIIDYLQQWNVNKALERKTKKIINMNLQLDTSAQEPHKYGKRFKEKLINKILPI